MPINKYRKPGASGAAGLSTEIFSFVELSNADFISEALFVPGSSDDSDRATAAVT